MRFVLFLLKIRLWFLIFWICGEKTLGCFAACVLKLYWIRVKQTILSSNTITLMENTNNRNKMRLQSVQFERLQNDKLEFPLNQNSLFRPSAIRTFVQQLSYPQQLWCISQLPVHIRNVLLDSRSLAPEVVERAIGSC